LFTSIIGAIIAPLAGIAILIGILTIIAISIASIYTAYIDIFDRNDSMPDNDLDEQNTSMIA